LGEKYPKEKDAWGPDFQEVKSSISSTDEILRPIGTTIGRLIESTAVPTTTEV
jgi:hypothetical protein